MLKSEADEEHRSDPRQIFLRHLPGRIKAIEENWRDLTGEHWNPPKLTQLFQRIQDLADSAGRLGLIQISESVFSLEQYFQTFLSTHKQPFPQQIEEVNGLIRHLRAVTDDVRRPPPDTALKTEDRKKKIFYLHANDALAPTLANALEELRCSVLHFTEVEALLSEAARDPPAALVVDTPLPPDLVPALKHISCDRPQPEDAPLLTVLSSSSNLNMRLSAMRAGAESFFVTPIDTSMVATHIQQLATSTVQSPCRVMIVDDDASQGEFTATILRKADMEACAITDPLQVLDTLESFHPDLILMDLYMPGANGMELTSVIRAQLEFVGIPIIFLSGEQDTDKQLDALSVGGDDFITKPIRPRHLVTIIRNRIQRARAVQARSSVQTLRDPVSRLFDRRYFMKRLDDAVVNCVHQPVAYGVICFALDRLEELQKLIGIGQSDVLLAELGSWLVGHVEPQDLCARLDDNSFGVLAKRPLEHDLVQLGESLLQAMARQHFAVEAVHIQPTLSVGICLLDAAANAVGLLTHATQACTRAQRQGGNCLEISAPAAKIAPHTPPQPKDLLALIRQGLRENSFQVLFQPFVDRHDKGRENYEMLPRLHPPEGDPINPAELFAIARRAVFGRDLDRWLTGRALDMLDERRQVGSEVRLLIHQTGETLADPHSVSWLRSELRQRLLVGTGLVFEFNLVDLATDFKSSRALIAELRNMGIEVCLARFGHNDASYKILRYLKAHYLKIAEKLLPAESAVIEVLLQRAHEMGTQVIVPHVDDSRVINKRWLSGADFVSGRRLEHPQKQTTDDIAGELDRETVDLDHETEQ